MSEPEAASDGPPVIVSDAEQSQDAGTSPMLDNGDIAATASSAGQQHQFTSLAQLARAASGAADCSQQANSEGGSRSYDAESVSDVSADHHAFGTATNLEFGNLDDDQGQAEQPASDLESELPMYDANEQFQSAASSLVGTPDDKGSALANGVERMHATPQMSSVEVSDHHAEASAEADADEPVLQTTIEHAVSNLSLLHQQHSAMSGMATSPRDNEQQLRFDATFMASTSSEGDNEADDTADSWHRHGKHFFILTSSGKPVYSYHGDENALAGLMALITAVISVVDDHGDSIRHILAGSTLIVFMAKGPLYFVATCNLGEPIMSLQRQLELLQRQIVLIVTTGLERIIQRNPAYDVRRLLEGVGVVLHALVRTFRLDPLYLLGAAQPLPMPAGDRSLVLSLLADAVKASGAFYAVLMAGDQVIAWDRHKLQPALDAADLLLLANFILCNTAIRHSHGEAFCPVCLPSYNPSAFLHAYIMFLDPAASIYVVLLAGTSDTFHQLSAAKQQLEEQLTELGVLQRLQQLLLAAPAGREGRLLVETLPKPAGGKLGSTPLWHFIIKYPHKRQAIMSAFTDPFATASERQRLVRLYARLISVVMDTPEGSRPNKMVWQLTERQALLSWLEPEFEVYAVMDPLTDKASAVKVCEALRKHFMAKEVQADLLLQ